MFLIIIREQCCGSHQFDADPVPDPAYTFVVDPDPDLFDEIADPGHLNDAYPDPHHCMSKGCNCF